MCFACRTGLRLSGLTTFCCSLQVKLTHFQEVSEDTVNLSAPETAAYYSSDASTTFLTEKLIDVLRGSPPVNATIVTSTLNVPAGSVNAQFRFESARSLVPQHGSLTFCIFPIPVFSEIVRR
jgi:hypothetical protein